MKTFSIVLMALLSRLSHTSILTDSGQEPQISASSPHDLESSYRRLYEELLNFDMDQAIVRYTDLNGEIKMLLPKRDHPAPQAPVIPLETDSYLDPGTILNLSIEFINSTQHRIVEVLYEHFKQFSLPMEVDVSGIKVSDIQVELEDLQPKDMNLLLSETDNSIIFSFHDLQMKMSSDLHIKKFMISESGSVNIGIVVEELIVKIHFVADPSTQLMVPQISAELITMNIPKDSLDIKLNLHYVPDFLSNFLISFFKGTLLSKINSFLIDFLKGDGSTRANQLFKDKYPNQMEMIRKDLLLSTLLTRPILVKADRLMVYVDGFFFTEASGKGKREYPSHMAFTKDDGNDVILSVSQESIDSLIKAVAVDIFQNQLNFEYQSLKASFKSNLDTNTFVIWESGMSVQKVLVDSQVEYLGFTFDMKFNMNMKFQVNKIDFNKKNLMVSINKIEINDYTFDSNIPLVSTIGQYLPSLIETFGSLIQNYPIPCPSPLLPFDISLNDVEFRYENGFTVIKVDANV